MTDSREGEGALPAGATGVTPEGQPAVQRRRWYRLSLRLWTEGRVDGRVDPHYCTNLSVGGIFIETDPPYPQGKEVQIEFSLPGIPESMKVRGRVVSELHADGAGVPRSGNGFEFVDLTASGRTLLERFIEAHASEG